MSSMRLHVCRFLTIGLLVISGTTTHAQDEKKVSAGEDRSVQTKDGWIVQLTYWPSPEEKDAPVVVLLHGDRQERVVWKPMAAMLIEEGFAVISVDLRKHGGTKPPENASVRVKSARLSKIDFQAMIAQDMEAVKKFIYDEHQAGRLNMRKLAVVASEMSTAIAVNFAARDWLKKPYDDAPTLDRKTPRGQDVQAIVLLSPVETLSGVPTIDATRFLRKTGMAGLLMFGQKDSKRKRAATKIYTQLGGEQQDADAQRLYLQGYDGKLAGLDLLYRQPEARPLVLAFLKKHVLNIEAEWRNRKSRLN